MTKQDFEKSLLNPYVKAGLDTIAKCEGVKHGYNTMYGNTYFSDLSKHPNLKVTKWGITSTAAGRYQFLYKTWKGIADKLGLTSFSAKNQDIGALYLLHEKGALKPLENGDILTAMYNARKVWASLPGAGYGQGERSKKFVTDAFNSALKGIKNVGEIVKENPIVSIIPLAIFFLIFLFYKK